MYIVCVYIYIYVYATPFQEPRFAPKNGEDPMTKSIRNDGGGRGGGQIHSFRIYYVRKSTPPPPPEPTVSKHSVRGRGVSHQACILNNLKTKLSRLYAELSQ